MAGKSVKLTDVLLVEDSIGDVLLVKQILSELPVNLKVARDGLQALLLLADPSFRPALVILDLRMPEISGHEVLARYHPRTPPIVVFSSSPSQSEQGQALKMGAREYVVKPMDLEAYGDAVRHMVEKWALYPDGTASSA